MTDAAIASRDGHVGDPQARDVFRRHINRLAGDLAIDLNFEVLNLGEDFDDRGRLRDQAWVEKTARALFASRVKDIERQTVSPFLAD